MTGDRATPGSQTSLRKANRARILEAVKHYGGLTQVELVSTTGLSAATVSNIVKELSAGGLIQTNPTSRSGRRALYVTLARQVGLVAGVEFGQRHLRVAVADFSGQVLADQSMPLPHDHRSDTGLDRASLILTDLLDSIASSLTEVAAVGLAMPAPINPLNGLISVPGIMPGWDGIDIAAVMSRRLDKAVYVDNNANLAALAEYRSGAGAGSESCVFLLHSQGGAAAGIILGGQVLRGHDGNAGEIGHIRVDPDGPICYCGNRGCLNTIVSATALTQLLRASYGPMTFGDLLEAAIGGDPGCRRVIEDAGHRVGGVAATVCGVVNPQRLIVGGELSTTGELFVGPLRDSLQRSLTGSPFHPVEVVPASLGDNAVITGAITLALDSTDLSGSVPDNPDVIVP